MKPHSERLPRILLVLFKQDFPDPIKDNLWSFSVRAVYSAKTPSENIKVSMIDRNYLPVIDSYESTSFRSGLSDMPSLNIAWENNYGIFKKNLTRMNMPKSPVLIVF